jgi:hypothetical protein
MEMGMPNMEAGLGRKPERGAIQVEGKTDQEIIKQLLDNVPEQKRNDLRELIEQNLAKGDRELPVILMRIQSLVRERNELYQRYEEAPANKKLEFSQKLITKWAEIEKVGRKMDQKIARTLLKGIMESLKISKQ